MRRVMICAMVLGLLPGLAFAQRGRAVGGVGPTARPLNVGPSSMGPMSTSSRVNTNPGPATLGHDNVGAATKPVGTSTTAAPSTGKSKNADSVGMTTRPVPDKTIPPDTGTVRPDSGIGPDR
jgi:hypothetical protein